LDIEPTYTVGEVALRRQKIIEKLTNEGVLEMNKELEIPSLPRRLAIISSKTAAGLEDFLNQLDNNPYDFKFYYKLFPAIMQGNEAEKSIINQLERIFQYVDNFDAVIIIRGGGAQADLDCFNNYWLAYHITQFPIPIITGIGHEQDDSVVDLVANTRLKTPTAVAEFLIDCFSFVYENLISLQQKIIDNCRKIVEEKKFDLLKDAHHFQNSLKEKLSVENKKIHTLQSQYIVGVQEILYHNKKNITKISSTLKHLSTARIEKYKSLVINLRDMLRIKVHSHIKQQQFNLNLKENSIKLNNPEEILRKGYSITLFKGNVVKDSTKLLKGGEIETRFYKGKRKSIISN
jgi:exodeoxyribonuclease VII large subunit